jgi:hypothetical protein
VSVRTEEEEEEEEEEEIGDERRFNDIQSRRASVDRANNRKPTIKQLFIVSFYHF